jgi:hypothetical protein
VGLVEPAADDDGRDRAAVGEPAERVAAHQDQVGGGTGGNATEVRTPERVGGGRRRRPEHRARRQPARAEAAELGVVEEAGDRLESVGADENPPAQSGEAADERRAAAGSRRVSASRRIRAVDRPQMASMPARVGTR